MQRKTRFLVAVAPRLMASVAKERRFNTWQWILAKADEAGVSRKSLSVLAALSCLVRPQGNPAKRLLKPSADFNEKRAYNALCDLRAVELFVYTLALFSELPATLCTKDRNLALFWVGLEIHNIRLDQKKHPTFELRYDRLLPDLTAEEIASLSDGA
jgi:hypothetical protein